MFALLTKFRLQLLNLFSTDDSIKLSEKTPDKKNNNKKAGFYSVVRPYMIVEAFK